MSQLTQEQVDSIASKVANLIKSPPHQTRLTSATSVQPSQSKAIGKGVFQDIDSAVAAAAGGRRRYSSPAV